MCTLSDQPRRATGLSNRTRLPCWRVPFRIVAVLTAITLGATAAFAQAPNLGKPISPADIAAWDISIMPDGSGLPPGSGTSAQGARIYAEKCSSCHGANGKGGLAAALIGGQLLAIRHDAFRLHPTGDAMAATADAYQ
jgi:Cytochrome c